MKSLDESRAAIDAVDREIVRLFEKRMAISRDVAAYKIANGMPVLDMAREQKVIQSRRAMLDDPHWADGVEQLYQCIMAVSRGEQERLIARAKEDAHD